MHVALSGGMSAIIDDSDLPLLGGYRWRAAQYRSTYYAGRSAWNGHRYRMLHMHSVLLPAPPGFVIDHINGNGLDNRRANLRIATPSQSAWNTRCHIDALVPYKGVDRLRSGSFHAQIQVCGRTIGLGSYRTAELAALAYDYAARRAFGEFARLNYPERDEDVAANRILTVKEAAALRTTCGRGHDTTKDESRYYRRNGTWMCRECQRYLHSAARKRLVVPVTENAEDTA